MNSRTDNELAVSRGLDSNFRRTDSISVVRVHLRVIVLQGNCNGLFAAVDRGTV